MDSLVSIIIPVYNGERYIAGSVECALSQEGVPVEVLIVDDASTDDTLGVLDKFRDDPRVRVVSQQVNQGAAAARNLGTSLAKGRFIAFLDADDLWSSVKLSQQVEKMRKEGWALSYTRYDLIDACGRRIGGSGALPEARTYKQLLRGNVIQNSTAVYDTMLLGGKVYSPDIRKRQDFGLFLRILRSGSVARLVKTAESTCSYRISPSGISHNKARNVPYQWMLYRSVEGLNLFQSCYYMAHWFVYAGLKTRRRLRS